MEHVENEERMVPDGAAETKMAYSDSEGRSLMSGSVTGAAETKMAHAASEEHSLMSGSATGATVNDCTSADGRGDCRASIGVFDSGVGGLTVAREIMRNLPNEHIVYFGDTARVPYGSKSKVTIVRYARQIIHFLRTQDVKAIVIACNTASALALDEVEKDLDIPIIGVIRPGARVAVTATKNRKIGVIGTESTINSHMYQKLIYEADPSITVYEKACPLFCPLVEEGWLKDPVTKEVAKRYLDELLEKDIDSLILGCTHYPLLRSLIREVVGEKITLVNPAYETAKELGELLAREHLENPDAPTEPLTAEPYRFFVSDMADKFGHFANSILPYDIETIQKINIEEY